MNSSLHEVCKFYYCISWGMRNYSTYRELDVLLIYLNNIEILSVDTNSFECQIMFEDNSKLIFWNESRWYAWMSSGSMSFSNGKILKWNGKMPSYEVLNKYRNVIKKYEREKKRSTKKISTIMDFSQYLPAKLIRKEKLKNINKSIN